MAWLINVQIDPDKTNVGSASAAFTDTDGTTFSFGRRDIMTVAAAQQFVTDAIAARNAWRTQKTRETNAINTLVADFNGAGETATAGAAS